MFGATDKAVVLAFGRQRTGAAVFVQKIAGGIALPVALRIILATAVAVDAKPREAVRVLDAFHAVMVGIDSRAVRRDVADA